jgi:PAS domain S-box-containing protein
MDDHRPDCSSTQSRPFRLENFPSILWSLNALQQGVDWQWLGQLAVVFLAYLLAGKLGQATTNIRSSNLGPVWPASGIALAAFLAYGNRVWPGIAASAFLVALLGSVPPLAAAGQAAGATVAALAGALLLGRLSHFDASFSRLRDVLGLISLGAFGSAILSASIGIAALYATGIQPYSGLLPAWFIYWLGDSTGVLLVTPLVFTLPQLFRIRAPRRLAELASLVMLLTAACFLIFGDLFASAIPLRPLAFACIPFVMWGAIAFGIAGATLSVFLTATIATVLTALGHGPFSTDTPFTNAVLLDLLFTVLAASGLVLAAVIAERERAESDREQLIREQTATEARLRLAAIVESTDDAIVSVDLDGVIQSWNAGAERIFGFAAAEAIGQSITMLTPPELQTAEDERFQKWRSGERVHIETVRVSKTGERIDTSLTVSPLRDATGALVGASKILRDVSEQKRATKALSRLSRRLIAAQEDERSRIARDLHDDIGQRLALLTIQLGTLSSSPLDVHGRAIALERQASEIAADIQSLSHGLHSSKLDLLGLVAGIRLACSEFAGKQNVAVHFESHDIPGDVPSAVSLTLLRVLQEALHNSAKHGGSQECWVQLWAAQGWIHLVVSDRGVGFDVETARRGHGLGLVSMEERIKLADGELSIESQPRRGTTIRVRMPLPRAHRE